MTSNFSTVFIVISEIETVKSHFFIESAVAESETAWDLVAGNQACVNSNF